MVLHVDPSTASETVLKSSLCAATQSIVAFLGGTNHAPNLLLEGSCLKSSSKIDLSCHTCPFSAHKIYRKSKYLYKCQAEISKRDRVSESNFDLFELARGPRFLARAIVSNGASEKDSHPDYEKWDEAKIINRYTAPPEHSQSSTPRWKHILSQYLGTSSSSFDPPPQTPVPPFTGGLMSVLGLMLICGAILDRWIWSSSRKKQSTKPKNMQSEGSRQQLSSAAVSMFLRRDLRTKESVEWVNMVLGKLWKVYRAGLERWLVGLLQPLIDNLQKPAYVERVRIKQFYLGNEPIAVRSVQRRASRHSNDLQYHIGLRYTGGARMLLCLTLKAANLSFTVPVGVRNLDVDGELWVKLRLVPVQPWVGATTWAFVSLPKIKLDLSLFRLFNIMAIPYLSVFLTKLLTEDLPQLFVLPKKISVDFLKGRVPGPASKDLQGTKLEGNKGFSGELSVTLVEARKLIFIPYGKSDPYVLFTLGNQVKKSKRNSQTSFWGPPGSPIWNQDFQFLVMNSKTEHLKVQVKDYFGFTSITIGVAEVDLTGFQDTVPVDKVIRLKGQWGPFDRRDVGEVLLQLTYIAYVEEDEDLEEKFECIPDSSTNGYSTDTDENDLDPMPLFKEVVNKAVETAEKETSVPNMLAAAIAELDEDNAKDRLTNKAFSNAGILEDAWDINNAKGNVRAADQTEIKDLRATLLWLALVTGVLLLVDRSVDFSNFMNP